MATETELYRSILTNLGVDCENLPDNLTSTLLTAIAQNCGGGGSSGGGRFDVNIMVNEDETLSVDKTFEEMEAAFNSGAVLQMIMPNLNVLQMASYASNGIMVFEGHEVKRNGSVEITSVGIMPDNTIMMFKNKCTGENVSQYP